VQASASGIPVDKPYEELTIAQRTALAKTNPELFNSLRADWIQRNRPSAKAGKQLEATMPDPNITKSSDLVVPEVLADAVAAGFAGMAVLAGSGDRKSTRLNSSHVKISYAVLC